MSEGEQASEREEAEGPESPQGNVETHSSERTSSVPRRGGALLSGTGAKGEREENGQEKCHQAGMTHVTRTNVMNKVLPQGSRGRLEHGN